MPNVALQAAPVVTGRYPFPSLQLTAKAPYSPGTNANLGMLALLQHVENLNLRLKSDLGFVNQWKYISDGLLLRKNHCKRNRADKRSWILQHTTTNPQQPDHIPARYLLSEQVQSPAPATPTFYLQAWAHRRPNFGLVALNA